MSERVMIVDDNPTNLKLASDVLESAGFTIDRAEDAEQAELILRDSLPDLILLDIALPGMDGLTLTRRLKSDPRYRRIPVIALTAFAMKGDDQKALEAGCDGYVTKPIDTRALPETIRAVLNRATAR